MTYDKQIQKLKIMVDQDKEMSKLLQNNRMEIAKGALEACTLVRGKPAGVVVETSLKQVALDIGMKYTTLQQWVNVRRKVYDQIPDNLKNDLGYRELNKINLELGRTHPVQKGPGSKAFPPKERVIGICAKVMNTSHTDNEIKKAYKSASALMHNLNSINGDITDTETMENLKLLLRKAYAKSVRLGQEIRKQA